MSYVLTNQQYTGGERKSIYWNGNIGPKGEALFTTMIGKAMLFESAREAYNIGGMYDKPSVTSKSIAWYKAVEVE